jgi:hypothetical protein
VYWTLFHERASHCQVRSFGSCLFVLSSALRRTGPRPRFHPHSSLEPSWGLGACWGPTGAGAAIFETDLPVNTRPGTVRECPRSRLTRALGYLGSPSAKNRLLCSFLAPSVRCCRCPRIVMRRPELVPDVLRF